MSNRTDFALFAIEFFKMLQGTGDPSGKTMMERLVLELHNAFVAGQEAEGDTGIHLTQEQLQEVVSILMEHVKSCDDYNCHQEAADTRALVRVFKEVNDEERPAVASRPFVKSDALRNARRRDEKNQMKGGRR